MKKSTIRNFALFFIAALSLSAFIFINTIDTTMDHPTHKKEMEDTTSAEVEKEMVLPDVKIVKQILKKGKGLVPASGALFR